MGPLRGPLALVVTFVVGLAGGAAAQKVWSMHEVDHLRETIGRLRQQLGTLQARRPGREPLAGAGADATARPGSSSAAPLMNRFTVAAAVEERVFLESLERSGGTPQSQRVAQNEGTSSRPGSPTTTGSAPTVETALERFYRIMRGARASQDGPSSWTAVSA